MLNCLRKASRFRGKRITSTVNEESMRKQVPSSAIGKDFRLANVVPGVGKHGVRRRQGICGVNWGTCGINLGSR